MKKLFTLKTLLLPIILFVSITPKNGLGQIVAWNTFGQTAYGTQGLAPITKDANVTVVGLTRGSGLTTSGTAAGNVWGGTGWSLVSSADAITNNKFVTYSIVPNPGYSMSLSSLTPFIIRASSTAPINVLVQYQVNSGSFIDIATRSITRPSSTSNFTLASIDLSTILGLQNVSSTSTITFRIVPYTSTSTSGAWYIGNQSNTNSLAINGTVITACTNPSVFNITGGGSYCSNGTHPNIGIDNSQVGVSYQLKNGGANTGTAVAGTGSSISFGPQSAAGTYTVVGTNGSCNSTMNGSVTITVNSCGTPTISTTSALADFGNVCINTTTAPNSFTIDGSNLNGTNISIAALAGFTYSENQNGSYTNTLNFTYSGTSFTGKLIYVKFNPTAVQSYNGNIVLNGGGVTNYSVPASGAGVNTAVSITTGGSSNVTPTSATISATINNPGCSAQTNYGFFYSLNSGFPNGQGTRISATNLSSGTFSINLTGLDPNARYYYKAYTTTGTDTAYGLQNAFTNAPLPVPMASQPGLSYTEDFHDIANWTNFFVSGTGANHWDGLSATGSGGIPNGTTITASTLSFQSGTSASPSSSGGVHRGTDQATPIQSIVLLSTGSTDNTTSAAIDFYMDFTGVNAGTLSFDWASVNNSTGDRNGSMRVYYSTNGIAFTELTAAAVLNFKNNVPTNGSQSNIALPAAFNNSPSAILRFYYYNGTGGTTGSRPKLSVDNLIVTAVPSTPCTTPTAQPTSMVFGTKTDVSIQGSFTAASPSSDQYLTVASTSNSLTSNPIDGVIYNIGDALDDGTVIAKGSSVNFTATGLSPSTTHYFFTFAVNGVCTGGPKYLTTNPLTGSAETNAALPSCTAPASQATNFVFGTTTTNSIQASFTATNADEYLVLKSSSSSLTQLPVNGQLYNAGDAIGNATVIQRNSSTTFTASGLSPQTQYYFYIFSSNSLNCVNGPAYNTAQPLTGDQRTQPLPPCLTPTAQPSTLSLSAGNTSISGAFSASASADNYLIIRSTSSTYSSAPNNNTDYVIGSSIGDGVVIVNSSSTSFTTTNLNTGTTYYFYVFAANKNCSGGTKYLTTSPLTGNATTTTALVNNYYFGSLHSHSDYSDGNKDRPGYTPAKDYEYAMTAQCMDFLGISEHNHFSSPDNPGNTITNFMKGPVQADSFTNVHPNFLALYGMEWGVISNGGHVVIYGDGMNKLYGWESGSGGWGATNNYDVYVPKSVYTGSTGLFKAINNDIATNTFATLAHPNSTDYNNLANTAYDITADNAIVGSAVASGPAFSTNTTYSDPSSMSYLWYYQTMLSKGYHLGPTIDHDNHNTTFGKTSASRTAVIAPSLSKTDFVKAMRDMHFYATEDCDTKVDFTVNTKIMGTVFSDRNAPVISVTLSDATTSTSSAIIRIISGRPGSGVTPVKIDSIIGNTLYFVDNSLNNGETAYYYADINNGSARIVTSPIWYTRTCSNSTTTENTTACDSYTWHGNVYTTSGDYTYESQNAEGCTNTATLHLIINHSSTSSETKVACDNYTWNGTAYPESGTYTYKTTNAAGCDSTVTLNLTINKSTTSSTNVIACDSYTWNGNTYTTSGVRTYRTTNAAGCDSTATLNLTITKSTTSSTNVIACDSYIWNETLYTQSGTYTYKTTNAAECDSTATLNLTINKSSTSSTNVTACDSYTWNETLYTQSGTYTYKTTNAAECDSTATLNLTINKSSTSTTNVTACDSYTWNENTYTTSGVRTYRTTNAAGCDSTATLNLTINHSSTSSETQVACDSYTWHGQAYTESGDYTYQSPNAEGCTNTATLHLTINHSTTTSETKVACDSYTWHGQAYTESGDYTYQSQNEQGCTNTATLHLTINRSTTTSETATACDSYTWHGQAYTESGDYTYQSQNAQGCTNTATLHLTINHSSTSSETATACGNYTWHGVTYTTSGNYTYQSVNPQGCTNTATLHLTINPKPSVIIANAQVLPNGVNVNTVYIGYAPAATLTVIANGSGGTPVYSYNWSAGSGLGIVPGTSTQSSAQVFASGLGNYSSSLTVTITDSKGCTATATVLIYVIDLRTRNKNDKITICHNGNALAVDGNSVQAHLKHGDKLGMCTSIITSARTTNNEIASKGNISESPIKEGISIPGNYTLSNSPNPFSISTIIRYELPVDSKVSLKIYNALGQVTATLFEGERKAGSYFVNLNASKLTPGLYYCKLIALSDKKKFIQSIKLSVSK
ncbi:MAG TPA: T9SS type A sorting domain-containing protein [Chitinophagaceae bacterium]|nr:T9SS type A sorting domain-containing protein [Chitinophagaceae bacterium]